MKQDGIVVVLVMEIYLNWPYHMICDLPYADRRND